MRASSAAVAPQLASAGGFVWPPFGHPDLPRANGSQCSGRRDHSLPCSVSKLPPQGAKIGLDTEKKTNETTKLTNTTAVSLLLSSSVNFSGTVQKSDPLECSSWIICVGYEERSSLPQPLDFARQPLLIKDGLIPPIYPAGLFPVLHLLLQAVDRSMR